MAATAELHSAGQLLTTSLSAAFPCLGQDSLEVGEVERRRGGNNDLLRSGGYELIDLVNLVRPVEQNAALDGGRIPADLLAPLVEYPRLLREGRHRPEAIPDIGVLRGDAERHSFSLATDHQRQRSQRRRIELGKPRLDPENARLQRGRPRVRSAEVESVLLIVAIRPAGTVAEHDPAAADVVDRPRHV